MKAEVGRRPEHFSISVLVLPISAFCFSQSVALALFARTPNRHLFRNFVLTPTRVEPFF
jgi:hypothetical protein